MLHGSAFVQEVAPSAAFDPLVQQAKKKPWRLTLAVLSAVREITETDFLSLLVLPLVTW